MEGVWDQVLDRDLVPRDLCTAPCYLVRLPPPTTRSAGARRPVATTAAIACPMEGDVFAAFPEAGPGDQDLPPSLRHAPVSAQRFWLRHAPPRPAAAMQYPSLPWSVFAKALRDECSGDESDRLFGRFDLDRGDPAPLESLRAALLFGGGNTGAATATSDAPGGDAEGVITAAALARLATEAAVTAPAPSAGEAERHPEWLALFAEPLIEEDVHLTKVTTAAGRPIPAGPSRLFRFLVSEADSGGRAGGGVEIVLDEEGLADESEAAAAAAAAAARERRPEVRRRVIAVLGRRGAGKSRICHALLHSDTLASSCTEEQGPADGRTCATTAGVMSHRGWLRDPAARRNGAGAGPGRGGGYALAIRLLDCEGESESLHLPTEEPSPALFSPMPQLPAACKTDEEGTKSIESQTAEAAAAAAATSATETERMRLMRQRQDLVQVRWCFKVREANFVGGLSKKLKNKMRKWIVKTGD